MLAMAIAWIGGLPGRCAFGASPPCATVRIDEPSDLSPAWADAVREARRSLAHAAEVGCDGVTVFVSGVSTDHAGEESVRISAMAVDGRRAERLVRKPSALPPTIYGLLASVPDDEPRSLVRDSAIPRESGGVSLQPQAASGSRSSLFEIWAGLAAGGRVTEPYLMDMLDFEGSADVKVRSWILCALFRFGVGVSGEGDDATNYSETDFGLGAGRSFALGATAVDALLVPSLATMRYDDRDESATPTSRSVSEFRLGVRLRWSLPISPSWHLTTTADTQIAPQGFEHPVRTQSDLPPLPAWTGGLRLGATGRLL